MMPYLAREDGTLKLVMSNSVPRSFVLIGKYLSALLSLFWPIAVSIIVALLMIIFSDKVSLSGSDFMRILLFVGGSLLYVSLFYLMGLVISAKTRRTATSLMLAMFTWVFLTLIYPNAGAFLADRVMESDPGMAEFTQIEELWEEFFREQNRYKERVVGDRVFSGHTWSGTKTSPDVLFYSAFESKRHSGIHRGIDTYEWGTMDDAEAKLIIEGLKQLDQHQEPLRIRVADQTWQIRKQALDRSYGRKQRLTTNILRLSPAAVYQNASTIINGTDLGSVLHFVDQAQQYRRSFIGYLNDEKAFSSKQWFWYIDSGENGLDLRDMPVFQQRSESLASSMGRGMSDVLLLIIFNVLFLILSHTFFLRQEIR